MVVVCQYIYEKVVDGCRENCGTSISFNMDVIGSCFESDPDFLK